MYNNNHKVIYKHIYFDIDIHFFFFFNKTQNKMSFVILLNFVIIKKRYHRESNENELTKKCYKALQNVHFFHHDHRA